MKKLLTLIAMLTIFAISTVAAQDVPKTEETKKEEPKKAEFPGKAGLEFKQTFQGAAVGNKVSDTEKSESAVYSKTEFKAKLDVPFFDNFYTFTPWIKDRIDIYFDPSYSTDNTTYNYLNSLGSKPTINGETNTEVSSVNKSDSLVKARNRAEIGFENKIAVKDVINVAVDPSFRFEYNINKNLKDTRSKITYTDYKDNNSNKKYDAGDDIIYTTKYFNYGSAAELVFMPSIVLDGKYKFGFEYKLNNIFYIHMFPLMDDVDSASIINKYEYEGTWDFSFDVLRPLNVDKTYSFKIFLQEYVNANFLTANYTERFWVDRNNNNVGNDYVNKSVSEDAHDEYFDEAYFKTGDFKEEFKAGIKGGISDFSVWANYDMVLKFNIDDCEDLKHNVWNGVQIGVCFKKATWEIGMEYTGQIQTWISTLNDDGDGFENRKVEDNDLKKWENTIEAYFKASI